LIINYLCNETNNYSIENYFIFFHSMKIITTLCGTAAVCLVLLFAPFSLLAQTPKSCIGDPKSGQTVQPIFEKGNLSAEKSGKKDKNNNQDGTPGGGGCTGSANSQTNWMSPNYGQRGFYFDVQNLSANNIQINSFDQAMYTYNPLGPLTIKIYRTSSANTFAGHQNNSGDWTLLQTYELPALPVHNYFAGDLNLDYRLFTLSTPLPLAPGQSRGIYIVANIGEGGSPIIGNDVGSSPTFNDGVVKVTGGPGDLTSGEFCCNFPDNIMWMGRVAWTGMSTFAPPSGLSGAPISGTQASLSWSYNSGCAGILPDYAYIEYSKKNGATWLAWQTLPLPGAPSFATLTGLTPTKTYRWRVRARYSQPSGPIYLISNPPYPQFTMPASLTGGGDGDEKQVSTNAALVIAPNPSHGVTSVFFPMESATNLRLFRLDGQLILEENRAEHLASGQFDLESLETGVYLIAVRTADGVLTQKLLVD
jgi:hypothetical protein